MKDAIYGMIESEMEQSDNEKDSSFNLSRQLEKGNLLKEAVASGVSDDLLEAKILQDDEVRSKVKGPPKKYERVIQKLEADIRGHIKLEHEMKIHMDYLENKIEQYHKQYVAY